MNRVVTLSAYVWNRDQLLNINPNDTDHLLGLFENFHMQYETDREGDVAGEPSLTEMTEKAIQVLQKIDVVIFWWSNPLSIRST